MVTSLRDGFVMIAVIALTLAAVRTGGIVVSAVILLVWFIVVLHSIVAVVGSASDCDAARGFVIPVFMYAIALFCVGATEFDAVSPKIFTSQILAQFATARLFSFAGASTTETMSLGHSMFAVLFGSIGSLLARSLGKATKRVLIDTGAKQ